MSDNGFTDKGGLKANSTYYFFDLFSSVGAYLEEGVLPNGTYTLDGGTKSANTIDPEVSYQIVTTADVTPVYSIYAEAVVVVSDNKIEATITMEDGKRHEVTYEGSLSWGDDNGGGDTPEVPEFEATHTATKWMWGGASTYGNKYMVSGEGFSVDAHFPAEFATETTLTAQSYTWTTLTMFGYNDFVEFTTRSFTVDGTSVAVDAGTAVVEAEGDVYHIEMTLQGRDGFTYMIEYNGKLNDAGSEGGEDTEAVVFTKMEYKEYNGSYGFYEYRLSNESGASMKLFVNDNQAKENFIYTGDSYDWISTSYAGNVGYFSTQSVIVDGAQVSVSKGNMVVVTDEETYHMDITITLNDTDVFKFSGKIGEDNGGGTTPSEPTKLATPSVFGNVEGNSVVISWQEIEGAKDYTVTLEGVETKTVTNAYISYANLAWETTYNVSVVANPSDEALYIASDAGTTSFTTGVQPEDGGDEGGNEGPIASYEDWVFSATLDQGAKLVTCTDGSHTITFTLSEIAGATFHINGEGTLLAYDVTVNGVAADSASGTISMKSEDLYHIVLDAYINGVHYTGTSTNAII